MSYFAAFGVVNVVAALIAWRLRRPVLAEIFTVYGLATLASLILKAIT